MTYKVVEVSTVTDEALEEVINHWVAKGWLFEGVQFAMRESSKRPAMAFVLFTRTEESPPSRDTSSEDARVDAMEEV